MKKPNNNNRFRNNNHNNNHNSNSNYSPAYSLNYKFDSNSIAGKISGTALDLIKKYNELAKDALQDNDYVTAEVFRQYAEHYRKIVTDINDKKSQNFNNNNHNNNNRNRNSENEHSQSEEVATESQTQEQATPVQEQYVEPVAARKEFKVIEISEAKKDQAEDMSKPKRTYRKKAAVAE